MDTNDIKLIIENPFIESECKSLKNKFLLQEAKYLKLSTHDFLGLVLLTPSISIALANKSLSVKEEIELNRKARELSEGKYFLDVDPVVVAMEFLLKKFTFWEIEFLDFIKKIINLVIEKPVLMHEYISARGTESNNRLDAEFLNSPYWLVKFVSFIFLEKDSGNITTHILQPVEIEKLKQIGEHLGIFQHPVFQKYFNDVRVK